MTISPTLAAALLALLLAHPGPSQSCGTSVSGTVSGTWTAAGSPYCVTASALVTGSLRIEAGARVRFAPGTELRVRGTLVVAGTAAAPVTLDRDQPNQPWRGVVLESTAGTSRLDNATIQGTDRAGLLIDSCTPSITACLLRDCHSATTGGGIDATLATGDLVIDRCRIEDCSSTTVGGGVRATLGGSATLTLQRCSIRRNQANPANAVGDARGGGLYVSGGRSVAVLDCELTDNRCLARDPNADPEATGGGAYVTGAGQAVFADCLIQDNACHADGTQHFGCFGRALAQGAGLCLVDTGAAVQRCLILSNRATATAWAGFYGYSICWPSPVGEGAGVHGESTGGATESLFLQNSVIAGNVLSVAVASYSANLMPLSRGSAVATTGVRLVATNCTLARNVPVASYFVPLAPVVSVSSGLNNSLVNSIVYDNGIVLRATAGLTVRYSIVQGGHAGVGNLDLDPQFVAATGLCAALELTPGSPAVDAGDANAEYDDTAFPPSLGTKRNDMGAQGGPLAAGWANWERSSPTLAVTPPRGVCATTALTFLTTGGAVQQPVGLFLEEIGGVPLAGGPVWLPVPARFCAAGRWQLDLTLPLSACTLPPLGMRSYALDAANRIVASNLEVW